MKKTISMLMALVLALSLSLAPMCSAYEYIETTDLGNGITAEVTTTIYESFLRGSTRKASRTMTFKNNGEEIATVTLTTTFGYDGSSAWVVSASGAHSTESGWTYRNEDISNSGGTSTLTAEIKNTSIGGNVPVNISLTCSKTGSIS